MEKDKNSIENKSEATQREVFSTRDTTPQSVDTKLDLQSTKQPKRPKRMSKRCVSKAKMLSLTLFITLLIASVVGLAVALSYCERGTDEQPSYKSQANAHYQRAYYDLVDSANDLGVKLKKIEVANSREMQQSLLYQVWGTAVLAENNLAIFQWDAEGMDKAQKFINQLGDYSKFLALKLQTEQLEKEDKQLLVKLGEFVERLKEALKMVGTEVQNGKMFLDSGMVDIFENAFGEFSKPGIEYPEMIYDGPFSDSMMERKVKGLKGENISMEQAQAKLEKIFKGRNASEIEFMGESESDMILYNFSLNIGDNKAFVQVSKAEGKMVSFDMLNDNTASNESQHTCEKVALDFAKRLNFENMEIVWKAQANGLCYINLAPVINDTIIYPDLVKIKIDEESNNVIGFDAKSYYFNHTEREIEKPTITAEEARKNLTLNNVTKGKLALIPLQEKDELLTYEFEAQQDGKFYIYIDAKTGKEVNILYVIDTPQGTLLQ